MSNDFEKYNKKTLAGVAKDAEAFAIRDLLAETNRNILCILSDGISLNQVYETLSFLQPEADILTLPAWDTVPYDRVSPNAAILSKRIETLAKLVLDAGAKKQVHRVDQHRRSNSKTAAEKNIFKHAQKHPSWRET